MSLTDRQNKYWMRLFAINGTRYLETDDEIRAISRALSKIDGSGNNFSEEIRKLHQGLEAAKRNQNGELTPRVSELDEDMKRDYNF